MFISNFEINIEYNSVDVSLSKVATFEPFIE